MKKTLSILAYAMLVVLMAFSVHAAQPVVDLGDAQNFSIVAETLISDIAPYSTIIGDIAMDPAAGSFIHDVSCTEVTGTIYDNNAGYTGGWDSNVSCLVTDAVKTLAVQSAMMDAYNDARGRTGTNTTELGAGNIGGLTLYPGLYKWSSAVTVPTDVTLDCQGNSAAVFIMQMSQTFDLANGHRVILAHGCQASNIFWQVDTGATLGTSSVMNGNIFAGTQITINTGATLNGRAFAQTAVTMDAAYITIPTAVTCTEHWTRHLSTCNGRNYTISYIDDNHCGTIFSLPANNGTQVRCSNSGGSSFAVATATANVTQTSGPPAANTGMSKTTLALLILAILGVMTYFGTRKKK